MREIKTVLNNAALLLAATGFCMYRIKSGKKVGHHSEIKSECHCKKEYRKFCFNGSERFYLFDVDIVACSCTWLYGGKRCEKTCGGLRLIVKNLTRRYKVDSKSDKTKKI